MGISSTGSTPALNGVEAGEDQSEGTTSQEDQGAAMLDMMLRDSILSSTNDAKTWLDELSDF